MDRNKWEYKKLGEVAKISSGKAIPSSEISEIYIEGFYPCYGGNGLRGYVNQYSNDGFIPVIGRVGALCGNVHLPQGKFYATEHALVVNLKTNDTPHYIEYLLNSLNLRQYAKGVAQPVLSASTLSEILIPIPPLSDQQRIVAELDCLNEMIAVKKEQLKEFDKLAQSIFYDMFGDPVENEKGWDIIELGTKCDVTSFKRVLIEDVVDSGIPFIRGTELMALSKATKGEKIDFTLFITPEHYEQVKSISGVPSVGDLLIPSINSEGNIWILDTNEPRYYKDGRVLWVHVNHDAFTSEALKYIMHILLKKTYSVMATGATFAELKLFVLRELKTILPPLALQQQFAEKIQAIEAQKELVKQSIAETQHLLDYTMDKYFG